MMRAEWEINLSDSAYDFNRIVWPTIRKYMGGGRLLPVEEQGEAIADFLDQQAGIDAWQIIDKHGIRGIASRVQWGENWKSFTIRWRCLSGAKTEWSKRIESIINSIKGDKGFLYPHLTIQAYVSKRRDGVLLGAGIIKTKDLYMGIYLGLIKGKERRKDNLFKAFFYDEIKKADIRMTEV